MSRDETLVARSLELARTAKKSGNHPFGALLADGDNILIEAENAVHTDNDPTQHAETRLVSLAARQLDADTLARAALYTSTEPCAMCAGAIYWTGIRKVVYGCPAETLGKMTGGLFVLPCREVFAQGKEKTEVVGPVLEKESIGVHEGFWN